MSASDENNSCSQSNTVVFEMIDGQLVTYQELNAGDRLTKRTPERRPEAEHLFRRTKLGLSFHAATRLFEEIDSVDRQYDVTTSLTTQDGVSCPVLERGRPRVRPSGGLRRAGGGCGRGAGGGRGVGGATWPCVPGGGCDAVPSPPGTPHHVG
ncbi:uncharacterized protein LOC119570651, partial [Penaeus monodon]|uniref:uncharacterized protein LOC119570651 n=1 Tax=Penaeus monodon TaxID=6687 RepID=UPI0018A784FC